MISGREIPLLFRNIFNFHDIFPSPFSMTFHDKISAMTVVTVHVVCMDDCG